MNYKIEYRPEVHELMLASLQKEQAIRRIRQYSGQEIKGQDLFTALGIDKVLQ